MKINITNKQYRDLVAMSRIANDVMGILGDVIDDKPYKEQSDRWEDLHSYLLDFAKDYDCGDLVEEWKGKIILNDKTSEKLQEISDDYDDYILWSALANKLAWRDFRNDHSDAEMEKMAKENGGYFGVELHDYEKKYWDEFKENGFERLEIR